MRIESLWAKGFRSLRDVRVDGLGAFNVLYGANGAGKSNILEAIQVFFRLSAVALRDMTSDAVARERESATTALRERILRERDLCARDPSRRIVLGAKLRDVLTPSERPATGTLDVSELTLEVTFDWSDELGPTLWLSRFLAGGEDLRASLNIALPEGASSEQHAGRERRRQACFALLQSLTKAMPDREYGLVRATRSLQTEMPVSTPPNEEDGLLWELSQGRLKSAVLTAQTDPRHEVRHRLKALRALLAGPPLHRPPFDPVRDPRTGEVDLRELLPEPNPEGRDISLDLAGLGIAQVYLIVAQAMLLRAHVIGIEEPEAHLHAPTSGRHLRQLLVRLVDEKYVDQLFVATHSNLFDLDPTGYFDVSLDAEGCTVVTRADLTRVDREHLYEPGPAKHALQRMLEYTPRDVVVFRRVDGSPVTAEEMLRMLQEDDAVAVAFLQDVHGAAVRMVKVQNKKPGSA